MTFLRAWLMILFGIAWMLALASATWILGDAVMALTGNKLAGFVTSLLATSLLVAWWISLPHDNRVVAWLVRQLTPPRA